MRKKRTIQKHFELSEYENEVLKSLVAKTGFQKECDVLRHLIMGAELIQNPGPEFYQEVKEMRKIGTNINQIAHQANSTGYVSQSDISELMEFKTELAEKITEIRRIVLEPKKKRDLETIIYEMEYMIWDSDEDQKKCWKLMEEIKNLISRAKEEL